MLRPADDTKPAVFVIMGGGGDLTWRKLVPSLFSLYEGDWLGEGFHILGVDRKQMDLDAYRKHLAEGIGQSNRSGEPDADRWRGFAEHISYLRLDSEASEDYEELAGRLDGVEEELGEEACRIFYLAVPPQAVETIVAALGAAGLESPRARTRVVVEKPFGWDLESARDLNGKLQAVFEEDQIFRIDHYLGKETVQNILAFRFANSLFEPIWDRRYIDHVQITVAERIGVGHRGGYYDQAGALRDMVQNHLMQVFTLISMEPPVSFEADEIRDKKMDVLRAVRPISQDQVHAVAARGQYAAGWMEGEHVKGYREEDGVDPASSTETFAALKLYVDNWRWQDVPFYLRTGKRMPARLSTASIHFRPVPHQAFPSRVVDEMQPNRLVITLQPDESIGLRFLVRNPKLGMRLSLAEMRFNYQEAFEASTPKAYETLLLDLIKGDATLFKRAGQVEKGWSVVDPVLEYWTENKSQQFPNYAAGSWGPESAEVLIASDGRRWLANQGPG